MIGTWLCVQELVQANNKNTPKLIIALCKKANGDPMVTGGFPSQMASNEECVSMPWYQHVASQIHMHGSQENRPTIYCSLFKVLTIDIP